MSTLESSRQKLIKCTIHVLNTVLILPPEVISEAYGI